PNLKQFQAKKAAVGESDDQSIARMLPSVSATASTSGDWLHNKKAGGAVTPNGLPDFRGPQVNQAYSSHTFSVNITQPVFHWDHWVQLSQADNKIAQAEADYQAELQKLMLKTTEAYFNVLSAQDNLKFTTAEKEAIARQLDQAKQRFEVGIIPITDVHEAQAGFDQVVANEIEAINNIDNQKETLGEIIGNSNVELNGLGEQLPLLKPEPSKIETWSTAAEQNNFSIVAAVNQVEFARKSIDIQRSGHLPQLDIVASYGVSDVNNSFGFRGDNQSVGLRLNVPLFEGGAVNSKTRQASYEYEAAKESLNATKRTVNREVKNAFRGVMTNIGRVEALKAAVASSESALAATEEGFAVGTRTMVEVLNEQRNLFKAKRDFARARYDYLIQSIKLKQSSSNLSQNDLEQINRLLTLADQK
ncbi:MAG: TolC family outer membrane protein, partial [Methylococcales bacterium]